MYPSALEMVAIAFPMPLYIACGVGLTTCIRVCSEGKCQSSHWIAQGVISKRTFSRSMGYMTECSCSHISSIASICLLFQASLTAMPANAPAAMLAASEKLGGRPS